MRTRKPEQEWFRFQATGGDKGELVLVGNGERSYLWSGPSGNQPGAIYTFSGPKALRKLARAILEETGEEE